MVIGKKDKKTLLNFIDEYKVTLSRIMLRYSIEHFSKEEKIKFLSIKHG